MSKNKKPDWFEVRNQTSEKDCPEIWIYGEIGDWFDENDAKSFSQAWRSLGEVDEVLVRIHSVGGSVYDGLAIYNTIKNSTAKVTTQVDGLAASMASVIALAGDVRRASFGTLFMIHEPWTVSVGDSQEMRRGAERLEQLNDLFVQIYADRTGLDDEEVRQMLSDETWMTANQALEKGFLTEITEDIQLASCGDKGVFASVLKNQKKIIQSHVNAVNSSATQRDNSNGSLTMAEPQKKGEGMLSLSQADLDTQLAAAKEEGRNLGSESLTEKLAQKENEAKAQERERIGSIMQSEEAGGRTSLAQALAFPEEGDVVMSAEQAIKTLSKAETQFAELVAVEQTAEASDAKALIDHLTDQTAELEAGGGAEQMSEFDQHRQRMNEARSKA